MQRSHLKGKRTGQYCSNTCRTIALNALPRKPARTANCRTCGTTFPAPYSKPDTEGKVRGIYCSRACMWEDDDYRKRRAVRHSPTRLEGWLYAALDAEGIRYEQYATVGRYVPDALLREHMTIIEADGVKWHRARVQYDQQRDRDLTAAGYTVMHFTDLELVSAKKAYELIAVAVVEIRAGRQAYRPPLLYRQPKA